MSSRLLGSYLSGHVALQKNRTLRLNDCLAIERSLVPSSAATNFMPGLARRYGNGIQHPAIR